MTSVASEVVFLRERIQHQEDKGSISIDSRYAVSKTEKDRDAASSVPEMVGEKRGGVENN